MMISRNRNSDQLIGFIPDSSLPEYRDNERKKILDSLPKYFLFYNCSHQWWELEFNFCSSIYEDKTDSVYDHTTETVCNSC